MKNRCAALLIASASLLNAQSFWETDSAQPEQAVSIEKIGFFASTTYVGALHDQSFLEDQSFVGLQIGHSVGERFGWSAYLEILFPLESNRGITDDSELSNEIGLEEFRRVPITLNLRFDQPLGSSQAFGYYYGIGLGLTHSNIDSEIFDATTGDFLRREDRSSRSFYGQLFAGLTWQPSDYVSLFSGARLTFFDEIDISRENTQFITDREFLWAFEAGARFQF